MIIAILPEIIKTMPKEANKIKHLINGEWNKVDEVIQINELKLDLCLSDRVLPVEKNRTISDDELTLMAITLLIGKEFEIII